ncbi:helix-turn-helix transcriptional regulator [Gluconacetobacter sp. Hr-1-5]|uniref:helix-turn-helix transcriptional regulator n=1 Tax=Gluconacetobacter sp. Hr-1-5 TaxID=3395370 RepID=UPI003B51BF13
MTRLMSSPRIHPAKPARSPTRSESRRPPGATEPAIKLVSTHPSVSFAQQKPVCRAMFNRIGLFRAERGLTRKALADLVDVNPQTIGFLERGDYKPSLELAFKIARVFDVPVEIMFSLEPFETISTMLQGRNGT